MRSFIHALISLSALSLLAGTAAAETLSANKTIERIEGVYKHRFANATVSGDEFESENILEIVRYKKNKIYFRLHLEFYNAHLCELYGIAEFEDGAFVYREPAEEGGTSCVLVLRPGKTEIAIEDAGGCRDGYCGARGSFDGETFARKSRREIRYMKKLKASEEFADSVKRFKETHASSRQEE